MGKKRYFRDEQKGAFFLVIILLIMISVGIVVGLSLRTDKVAEKISDDQVIRVLLVLDNGKNGERKAVFTNMLLYYPVSRKAALVNIPGHTGGIYQSLGRVDRIDRIYSEKGIEPYLKEIEKVLDVNIPFFMVIGQDDFVRLTDMLGGLRVFIPFPVDKVSDDGELWLLPSGAVTLDGDKISVYLHYKLDDEEETEINERYQNVVNAFFTALHDKRSQIFSNRAIFKEYGKLMSTNLTDSDDVYKLLSLISDMDSESTIRQTVTGPIRIVDGQRLMLPLNNGDFIKEALKQSTRLLITNSVALASRVYVLEIKNGTSTQGLARNTAILFQNASYSVLNVVNADSSDYEKTVIIDHIGNKEVAGVVGEFIHCNNIVEEAVASGVGDDNVLADVDFTIILGKDFDGRYVRPAR